MLFNSFEFLIFFPIVCITYFLLKNNKYRNPFLLVASYYFYMNWKPIYALLLIASTLITYFGGILIENKNDNKKSKKIFLILSLVFNLGILFVFKYYNFINGSIFNILQILGIRWVIPNLDILLPIGISFYTFIAAGYIIDIYKGNIKAERNIITYSLFIAFFPQILAGPIGRAKTMLPQFHKEHSFSYDNAVEGIKMMIWGYFMKLCVADRISEYVNAVFDNVPMHNGNSLILASILFTLQIYCDFAGYSNIAIGAGKVMGYDLMENFHRPYLSLSIKEFWKRWHISLSSWFMDYLYIPLGGNRVKYWRYLFNLFITFAVSGIWHGANWTFFLWGSLHGIYLIIYNIRVKFIGKIKNPNNFIRLLSRISVFCLVSFAWIFFRANNVNDLFVIITKIFTQRGNIFINKTLFFYSFMSLTILIFKDIKDEFNIKLNFMHSKYTIIRYCSVILLITFILLFGALNGGNFIYFKF